MASTRPADALVVGGEEPDERHEQHGGIERGRLVVLAEAASIVERVGDDVGLDLLRGRLPAGGVLAPVRERSFDL